MNKQTNEAILKQAIRQAVASGYAFPYSSTEDSRFWEEMIARDEHYRFIFDHEFAKAFWGGWGTSLSCYECPAYVQGWQYHLQQMVLEDDPIRYLEQFLDEKGGDSA